MARREERTLSKALTFSAGATRYAIKTAGPGMALRGAKVTLLHMLDGTLRVRFKDRDLAFTPFKTLPAPLPVEDDKTLDARARRRHRPKRAKPNRTAPARAWITAWLATALWEARFAKPLSTPTQPTQPSQKGDISTWPEKGTFQLCLDRATSLCPPTVTVARLLSSPDLSRPNRRPGPPVRPHVARGARRCSGRRRGSGPLKDRANRKHTAPHLRAEDAGRRIHDDHLFERQDGKPTQR